MRRDRQTARSLTLGVVLAAGLLCCGASTARADDEDDAPVYAVQNRQLNLSHEFHVSVGVLPIDAFTKGLTVGGGYTYHFNQMVAWEIAQFSWSFGIDTNLKQELLDIGQVKASNLNPLHYFGSSSLVLKPLYGKFAVTNRYVVHAEIFFAAGGAVGVYTSPATVRPGFDAGVGLRFYLGRYFSLRVDLRDLTFFGDGVKSELYLGLGVALTFGGSRR